MDSILIGVTVAAIAVALGMSLVAARLLRDERHRSAARVAALAGRAAEVSASVDRVESAVDFDLRETSPLVSSGALFIAPHEPSAWPRRLGIVAALASLAILLVAGARGAGLFTQPARDGISTAETSEAGGDSPRLELLSLTYAQQPNGMTITGLVQNPRSAAALTKVSATAFLFGDDGTFLASGRAPLDFTVLRPGDEAGFTITVTVSAPVARYRVGFRGDDGRIIGHIDRRSTAAIARGPS